MDAHLNAQAITLNEVNPHEYLVTWLEPGGNQRQHTITLERIEARFPKWCSIVKDCHEELNPAVPLEDFLRIAAYSDIEPVMRRKQFLLYRHVAWAAGFAKRTKLPERLELAIKNTWSEPEEEFVGYLPLF